MNTYEKKKEMMIHLFGIVDEGDIVGEEDLEGDGQIDETLWEKEILAVKEYDNGEGI